MFEFHEWEIKNFSCWSCNIHGDGLVHEAGISLNRRPVGRKGDYLVVSLDGDVYGDSVGELSFISSDGSVICSRRSAPDLEQGWVIFTGPNFNQVAALIRRNEPLHKDRLILRWDKSSIDNGSNMRLRTVIKAYSSFFHIKPKVFDLKNYTGNQKIWNIISNFKGVEDQFVELSACKTGTTLANMKIKFKLKLEQGKETPIRTSIWMLNGDNIMEKCTDNCVLYDEDHIIRYAVPFKELQELQTIMRCKIIAWEKSQNIESLSDFGCSPFISMTCFSRSSEIKSLGDAAYSNATKVSDLFLGESHSENAVAALTKDFTCLYLDHNFSDFEMRCGATSFPTHRNILSARSPVLKAMLSGGMREATSGHMDIKDLDPHTLGHFLAFLYSGTSVKNLEWESALRLYYAADKYQVPSLKNECVAVLQASVSLENVCDILSLADNHQDTELRSVSHNFILKNFNEVLESEEWEKLMKRNSLLVAKTVTHFAKNKYVQKSDST